MPIITTLLISAALAVSACVPCIAKKLDGAASASASASVSASKANTAPAPSSASASLPSSAFEPSPEPSPSVAASPVTAAVAATNAVIYYEDDVVYLSTSAAPAAAMWEDAVFLNAAAAPVAAAAADSARVPEAVPVVPMPVPAIESAIEPQAKPVSSVVCEDVVVANTIVLGTTETDGLATVAADVASATDVKVLAPSVAAFFAAAAAADASASAFKAADKDVAPAVAAFFAAAAAAADASASAFKAADEDVVPVVAAFFAAAAAADTTTFTAADVELLADKYSANLGEWTGLAKNERRSACKLLERLVKANNAQPFECLVNEHDLTGVVARAVLLHGAQVADRLLLGEWFSDYRWLAENGKTSKNNLCWSAMAMQEELSGAFPVPPRLQPQPQPQSQPQSTRQARGSPDARRPPTGRRR